MTTGYIGPSAALCVTVEGPVVSCKCDCVIKDMIIDTDLSIFE